MTPLFRGEGRLKPAGGAWSCESYQELSDYFRQNGFPPRAPGLNFLGTIPEQILQQGYVNQGTVSLTESFDVAACYATKGREPNSCGVVFTIDRECLRRHGEIYDSYASMRRSLDWFFKSDFETMGELVRLLDVADSGEFLNRCDRETRELVQSGGDAFVPDPDWSKYFQRGEWDKLGRAGIRKEQLTSLHRAFRGFWMYALGHIGTTDTILLNPAGGEPQVKTKRAAPLAYYHAFLLWKESCGTCRQARPTSTSAIPAGRRHHSAMSPRHVGTKSSFPPVMSRVTL